MHWLKQHWAWPAATGFFWLLAAGMVMTALHASHGRFVYPLDDSYIHLAMAKHFAQQGVWGLTRQGFSSSTSSPLWTFLLAMAFKLFGVHAAAAFILAMLFGTGLLATGYFILKKHFARPVTVFGLLSFAILAAPLPALAFTGLEHVLHAWLTLGFAFCAARVLAQTSPNSRAYEIPLLLLAPLMTLTRFESFFILFLVAALLAARKRGGLGFAVAALGILPVAGYGLWSKAHGWFWLPTSILLKGNWPGPSWFWYLRAFTGSFALENLRTCPHMLVLLVLSLAAGWLAIIKHRFGDEKSWFNVIFIGAVFLHMQFAGTGWFYRYEAYLVFLGMINLSRFLPESIPAGLRQLRPAAWVFGFLMALTLAYPLGLRAFRSLREAPQASRNIFEQQVQVGLFLQHYCNQGSAAVNDAGAVCFFSDARILDIWGIGDRTIAASKLARTYSTRKVDEIARQAGIDIAFIYDSWLTEHGDTPATWDKIGVWQIPDNVVCGDDKLSIYVLRPSVRNQALRNLKDFSSRMPADVRQSGAYLESR